jgi:hypothetical protein
MALLPGIVEPYVRRTCSELIESQLSSVLPGPREEDMPINVSDSDNDADDDEGPGPSRRQRKRPESGVGQLRSNSEDRNDMPKDHNQGEDESYDDNNGDSSRTGRNKVPVVLNVSKSLVFYCYSD